MEETMEVDAAMYTTYPDTQDRSRDRDNQNAGSEDPFVPGKYLNSLNACHSVSHLCSQYPKLVAMSSQASAPVPRDNFREIQVKVHIRKPDRDSWSYLGRGVVSQDVAGHSSRVGTFDCLQLFPRLWAEFISFSEPLC